MPSWNYVASSICGKYRSASLVRFCMYEALPPLGWESGWPEEKADSIYLFFYRATRLTFFVFFSSSSSSSY